MTDPVKPPPPLLDLKENAASMRSAREILGDGAGQRTEEQDNQFSKCLIASVSWQAPGDLKNKGTSLARTDLIACESPKAFLWSSAL